MKNAIKAGLDALKIITLQKYPIYYAKAQNNLGNAYSMLSFVKEKEINLNKSITAYEESLKIWTLEKYPTNYGLAQIILEIHIFGYHLFKIKKIV